MKLQGERERDRLSASGDCLFGLGKVAESDKAQRGKEIPSFPFK